MLVRQGKSSRNANRAAGTKARDPMASGSSNTSVRVEWEASGRHAAQQNECDCEALHIIRLLKRNL